MSKRCRTMREDVKAIMTLSGIRYIASENQVFYQTPCAFELWQIGQVKQRIKRWPIQQVCIAIQKEG